MQGHVLLPCRQVDYKRRWDVAEGIELVRLAEVEHVPNQSLLVRYLSMELKVIKANAVFT